MLALQGNAAGVYVKQASGIPGGGSSKIEIRGDNNLMSTSNPLYIIDGVPFNSNEENPVGYTSTGVLGLPDALNFINPDDIESMEILKDADATAIYGTRGANGVVLITTKKGKAGKIKVNLQYSGTASWIGKRLDFVDTETYLDIRQKAFEADKAAGYLTDADYTEDNYPDLLMWDQTKNYDWQEILLGNTGWANDMKATISGGNKNTSFYVSGGYYGATSPTIGKDKYTRWTTRSNVQHHSSDNRLNIDAGFSLSQIILNANAAGSGYTDLNTAPNTPPYNEDGTVYWIPGDQNYDAPLSFLNYSGDNKSTSMTVNFNGSYRVWDQLVAKVTVGYEHSDSKQQNLYERNYYNPYDLSQYNFARYYTVTTSTVNIEPQLTYTASILRGDATFLLGGTYQKNQSSYIYMQGIKYPGDIFLTDANSASTISYHKNPTYQSKTASVFGRVSYNYYNRYLFNAVFRRDGSSKFGPNKRWGNFYSFGGGWIFTNEDFTKDAIGSWLSYGKLRMSYGKTGSDRNVSDYAYMTKYTASSYPFENSVGIVSSSLANPDLHWETTRKFDIGLELGFINDRILLNANYYLNRSSDLLTYMYLPYQTGFNRIVANQDCVVQNSGLELEINTVNIKNKDWQWTSNFNFSIPKNKLVKYPGLESSAYSNTYVVGQSVNIYRGYKYTGVNPDNGVPMVEDVNGDGLYKSADDYQTLGSSDPRFFGGFSNTIKYKRFTLDINFYFRNLELQYGYYWHFYNPIGFQCNITKDMANNYWTTPGQSAKYPGLTSSTRSDIYYAYYYYLGYSDFAYSSGSYLRLKNLKFAYDFPTEWIKPLGMSAAQIYVQGTNLFTITNYDSYDPETGTNSVPVTSTFTFGVNVTF